MADNKTYTLESAKELFSGDNWDATIEKMSLEEMMSLDKAIYGQPIAEGVADEAAYIREEAQKRIESLLEKDLAPDELDSIAAFVEQFASHSINGESVYVNDAAKALMAKVEKQKDELAAAAQQNQSTTENSADPITIDENAGDEQTLENQTQNDTAENTTQPQADEFVLGDESNAPSTLYEINEETGEITYLDDEGNPLTEETQEEEKTTEENAQDKADEEILEAAENIPEEPELLDEFDKEYGIDTMTEEQLNKNAEFMEKKDNFNPFALNEEGKLVNPEYQEEYDAFQKLEITNDEGEKLPEDEQKKYKETLLETAVFEAGMLTRGTAKGDELEPMSSGVRWHSDLEYQYQENLKSSLQKAIVTTTFASDINKKMSKEEITSAFTRSASQEGGFKAKAKAILAYAGVVNGEMTKVKDRLKNKFKSIPAIQKMEGKIAAFDKSMTEKHPKTWNVVKRLGNIVKKKGKSVAMYTAIGAMAGPAAPYAFAALAVKSGYDACKNINKKAKESGQSFWQYAKSHKAEVGLAFTTTALSVTGAAIGVSMEHGLNVEKGSNLKSITSNAVRVMAVAPKAIKAFSHNIKSWMSKDPEVKAAEKAKAKEAWQQTGDAFLGIVLGGAMSEGGKLVHSDDNSNETQPEPKENPENGADRPLTEEEKAALKEGFSKLGLGDKDQDGKIDLLDRDHGEGWANYTTQVDRAFDADPAGINEEMKKIDPDWKWHSSEELKEMWEKTPQEGGFTDEQMKAISAHANSHFDENGHIIDPELREHYNNLNRASDRPEPLKKVEDIAPIKIEPIQLDLNTKADIPEHLEIKPLPEVHDEKFYQDMKDGTKGLNNEAKDALEDPNKTVDDAIKEHYGNQVAQGNLTESQADKASTTVRGNVGTLYGKEDDDLTQKEVKQGIKTSEKAFNAAKENAEEFIQADQAGKNVDAAENGNYVHRQQEVHPDGYSQNIESSEACKGMEDACRRMQAAAHHGDNIGHMMNEEMKSGNLSEEQAVAMNERYSELRDKGYSDERALRKMADDYHRIGNDYLKHQEYAAEHQNANAHTADNTNTDTNPGATAKAATNDGTTTTTPSAKVDDKANTDTTKATIPGNANDKTSSNMDAAWNSAVDRMSSQGFEAGESLKEGQYVESKDAQGYRTIVGKDQDGNTFRLTQMNGGWESSFPKDSPYNDRINAGGSDGFPQVGGGAASISASINSSFSHRDVTTELLQKVGGMEKVSANADTNTVDMGRHHSADSTTADKTPTLSERLSQLSGRSTPSPVTTEPKVATDHIPSKEELMGKTLSLSQINGGR